MSTESSNGSVAWSRRRRAGPEWGVPSIAALRDSTEGRRGHVRWRWTWQRFHRDSAGGGSSPSEGGVVTESELTRNQRQRDQHHDRDQQSHQPVGKRSFHWRSRPLRARAGGCLIGLGFGTIPRRSVSRPCRLRRGPERCIRSGTPLAPMLRARHSCSHLARH